MSMDLDDLQLLLDVAELGSFSQAAAIRGWSQPLVSQRIAQLEASLGAPLFQRHRRGVTPTRACDEFLPSARSALNTLNEGRLALRGAPALPCIRLSSLPSLTSVVFGSLLMELVDESFEIRCTTDHSGDIMQALLTGEADIGFVLKRPPVSGLQMEQLCCSPIIAIASPLHPLAGCHGLTLEDIADHRLAPQVWGPGFDAFIQQLRRIRRVAGPINGVQPASAARELALEHGFITLMPELVIARDLEMGRLIRLDVSNLPQEHWDVMMAWRGGKRPNPAREKVLATARAMAKRWRKE